MNMVNRILESVGMLYDITGVNLKSYSMNAEGLQKAIDVTPTNGVLNIPAGSDIITSKTINVTKPITINGLGSKITAEHSAQNVIFIASDSVIIQGLSIIGNSNENGIQIKEGMKDILIENIKTSEVLNGISSQDLASKIKIQDSDVSAKVQGIILRLPSDCEIRRCTIDNIDVLGGTAIKLMGREKAVEAYSSATKTFKITGHKLKAGDRIRFYGTGTMPTGSAKDTSYYVSAKGLTANEFTVALPGGTKMDDSVSVQNFVDVNITGSNLPSPTNLSIVHVGRSNMISDIRSKKCRAGIYLVAMDECEIDHNNISDGTPIQIENSWHNTLSRNTVRHAIDLGLNLHKNSSYNQISENHALYCMNAGIGLTEDVLVGIANNNYNQITNNHSMYSKPLPAYPSSTGHGIEMNLNGRGNVLTGNHCIGNARHGIRVAGGMIDTVIKGGIISNNLVGVKVSNDGAMIEGVLITGNVDGIHLDDNINFVQVNNCRVRNNLGWGVYLGNNSRLCIGVGNTINSNNSGHVHLPTNQNDSKFDATNNILIL